MSVLIPVLTAASLLTHTVLGCCWHHAHGQESPAIVDAREASHSEPCERGHACGEYFGVHASAHGCAVTAADCDSGCDAPDCSYVNSQSAQRLLTLISVPAAIAAPPACSGLSPAERALCQTATATVTSAGALRARLQVWLI